MDPTIDECLMRLAQDHQARRLFLRSLAWWRMGIVILWIAIAFLVTLTVGLVLDIWRLCPPAALGAILSLSGCVWIHRARESCHRRFLLRARTIVGDLIAPDRTPELARILSSWIQGR